MLSVTNRLMIDYNFGIFVDKMIHFNSCPPHVRILNLLLFTGLGSCAATALSSREHCTSSVTTPRQLEQHKSPRVNKVL